MSGDAHPGEIRVGDEAPDFELPSSRGGVVRLSDFRGRSSIVLVFYPGDFTPICTKQLCAYASSYKEFEKRGFAILGIGIDPVETHRSFTQEKKLTFPLLSDEEGKVCRAYGVAGRFIKRPKRSIFLVDREGKIQFRHVEALSVFYKKVDAVLDLLEKASRKP